MLSRSMSAHLRLSAMLRRTESGSVLTYVVTWSSRAPRRNSVGQTPGGQPKRPPRLRLANLIVNAAAGYVSSFFDGN